MELTLSGKTGDIKFAVGSDSHSSFLSGLDLALSSCFTVH